MATGYQNEQLVIKKFQTPQYTIIGKTVFDKTVTSCKKYPILASLTTVLTLFLHFLSVLTQADATLYSEK